MKGLVVTGSRPEIVTGCPPIQFTEERFVGQQVGWKGYVYLNLFIKILLKKNCL